MAASKRANGVPSALVARQSLNDEELVRTNNVVQGGPKSGTLLIFEFPTLLDALLLQFWFNYVLLSQNVVIIR